MVREHPGYSRCRNGRGAERALGQRRRNTPADTGHSKNQPDIVILCSDQRGADTQTTRSGLALRTLQDAVAHAATTLDTSRSAGFLPWSVSRIAIQTRGSGLPGAFNKKHPVLNLSATATAQSVSRVYRTMRLQIGDWVADGREYHLVSGNRTSGPAVAPDELLRGLPAISARMKGVDKAIRAAVRIGAQGVRTASLAPVSRAIDVTERILVTQRSALTRPEQRLMVTWKNGLEALRCAVLGVTVHVEASESLLTASQVFYFRVEPPRPRASSGQTEIIFPLAAGGEWTVNGGSAYHFPLDSASSFTVFTPGEIPFTVPAGEYGLTQPSMSTTFPYDVVHKDAQRERNFMYRETIRLRIGPRRSFVLRTPLVADDRSSPVIYELQNFSRDRFTGTVTLSDTSGHAAQRPVSLTHKDQILTDTVYLPVDPAQGEGRRLFALELSGRGGRRPITAQRVNAVVDSTARVVLLSTVDGSPLADALRVLRQPHVADPLNAATRSWNTGSIVQIKTTR